LSETEEKKTGPAVPETLPSANDLAMRAVNLFKNDGMDCETAVVTVFDELFQTRVLDGLEPRTRRIGLGFQTPCGALLGAARVVVNLLGEKHDAALLRQEIDRAFVAKHRSATCQYLTAHVKWGEHHVHCGKYVYSAVENLWAVLEPRLGDI
jgi:hypothetical protein